MPLLTKLSSRHEAATTAKDAPIAMSELTVIAIGFVARYGVLCGCRVRIFPKRFNKGFRARPIEIFQYGAEAEPNHQSNNGHDYWHGHLA